MNDDRTEHENPRKEKKDEAVLPAIPVFEPPQQPSSQNQSSIPLELILAQESKTSIVILEGPLPPPELIEGYARIHPEAGKIIFEAFQGEIRHRQRIELIEVISDQAVKVIGLVSVVLIAFFGIYIGAGLIREGHDWAGSGLVVTALGTIIAGIVGAMRIARATQDAINGSPSPQDPAIKNPQTAKKPNNRRKK